MSSTKVHDSPMPSDATRAEAAAWIARLHGPQRSTQLEAGLRCWLAEDPANAIAFSRMTDAWEAATAVASGPFPRIAAWQRMEAPHLWARAAVIVFACALLGLGGYLWWSDPSYSTGIGEQRIVRLQDGSRISLNSASRIVVDYREAQRRVRLEKGEAYFEVASGPRRPFIVLVGEREVIALGTSFSVRYEPDRLAVMLVDGKVAVSAAAPPEARTHVPATTREPISTQRLPRGSFVSTPDTVTLQPGQRLVLASAALPKLDMPAIEAITAWRRGQVMLNKTALADAVAEMNRYDEAQLVIDDGSIANLVVSGVYRTGDSAGFANGVARIHGLEVAREGDRIHLRDPASRNSP